MDKCKNCGCEKSSVKKRKLPDGVVKKYCKSCHQGITVAGRKFAGGWDTIE